MALTGMPREYVGREHTWLKHRVLRLYLEGWAHKLASAARRRAVRLWYVDCFAGPWKASDAELRDTSIVVGLDALEAARNTWLSRGYAIETHAVFVERDPRAYSALTKYLASRRGGTTTHPLNMEFGSAVPDMERLVGDDAAFVFVDPTGWKGAGMRFIAPLLRKVRRDVLVNVMFDHINRLKDDPRAFLRKQLSEFFGDSAIPRSLSEDELLRLYRTRLKQYCGLPFAADLAVPYPDRERTKMRLVIGGQHREVLRLFRDVEKRVVGQDAARARTEAKERRQLARDGQLSLLPTNSPPSDRSYADLREAGLAAAEGMVAEQMRQRGSIPYGDLWPPVLECFHITEPNLAAIVGRIVRQGQLRVPSLAGSRRRVKDEDILRLGADT